MEGTDQRSSAEQLVPDQQGSPHCPHSSVGLGKYTLISLFFLCLIWGDTCKKPNVVEENGHSATNCWESERRCGIRTYSEGESTGRWTGPILSALENFGPENPNPGFDSGVIHHFFSLFGLGLSRTQSEGRWCHRLSVRACRFDIQLISAHVSTRRKRPFDSMVREENLDVLLASVDDSKKYRQRYLPPFLPFWCPLGFKQNRAQMSNYESSYKDEPTWRYASIHMDQLHQINWSHRIRTSTILERKQKCLLISCLPTYDSCNVDPGRHTATRTDPLSSFSLTSVFIFDL